MSKVRIKKISTMKDAFLPVDNSLKPDISGFNLYSPKIKEARTILPKIVRASKYRSERSQPALKRGLDEADGLIVYLLWHNEDRGPAKLILINFCHQSETDIFNLHFLFKSIICRIILLPW